MNRDPATACRKFDYICEIESKADRRLRPIPVESSLGNSRGTALNG